MKALIAEDSKEVQLVLLEYLYSLGFDYVDAVTNGKALCALGSTQVYDIMLIDVIMPEWTGLEGLELARALGSESPVIVSTGNYEMVKDVDLPILLKPFTLSELKDKLKEVIGVDFGSDDKFKNFLIDK